MIRFWKHWSRQAFFGVGGIMYIHLRCYCYCSLVITSSLEKYLLLRTWVSLIRGQPFHGLNQSLWCSFCFSYLQIIQFFLSLQETERPRNKTQGMLGFKKKNHVTTAHRQGLKGRRKKMVTCKAMINYIQQHYSKRSLVPVIAKLHTRPHQQGRPYQQGRPQQHLAPQANHTISAPFPLTSTAATSHQVGISWAFLHCSLMSLPPVVSCQVTHHMATSEMERHATLHLPCSLGRYIPPNLAPQANTQVHLVDRLPMHTSVP